MSETELKPCPFCGSAAGEAAWPRHVGCTNRDCGAFQANLAIRDWNRRSTGERERALEEAAKVADQMAREEDVLADHYRDHTPSPEQREDAMCRAAAHRDVATNIRALKSQELREEI